jgi:hypothetical protein
VLKKSGSTYREISLLKYFYVLFLFRSFRTLAVEDIAVRRQNWAIFPNDRFLIHLLRCWYPFTFLRTSRNLPTAPWHPVHVRFSLILQFLLINFQITGQSETTDHCLSPDKNTYWLVYPSGLYFRWHRPFKKSAITKLINGQVEMLSRTENV